MAIPSELRLPVLDAAATREFRETYLLGERPVVLRGLHAGSKLMRLIGDAEALRDALGSRRYRLSRHVTRSLHAQPENIELDLATYMDVAESLERGQAIGEDQQALVGTSGRMRMHQREFHSPPELVERVTLPPHADFHRDIGSMTSRFFFGAAGTSSGLHFDWDHRHVLFTQLLGTKRCVLVPPRMGALLRSQTNMCGLQFWLLPAKQQSDLLIAWGASEVLLEPGDSVFMPRLYWHHLESTSMAVSFNLRFGSNPYSRVLSSLPPMFTLQNLSLALTKRDQRTPANLEILDRVLAAFFENGNDALAAYKALRTEARRLYEEFCVEALPYALFDGAFDPEAYNTPYQGLQWKLQNGELWATSQEGPDSVNELLRRRFPIASEELAEDTYFAERPLATLLSLSARPAEAQRLR